MAEEDDVDVEGDFELKIGIDTSALYDVNEPPSKSANLLPEFTQHPWLLEQGWSLDHCADDKSKAAIEKMLLEEQQYLNGRGPAKVCESSVTSPRPRPTSHKKSWTEQEKEVFFRGMEIYGRSWSRIAELIPSRTVQQVKNFGQQYIKMKAKSVSHQRSSVCELMSPSSGTPPTSVNSLLQAITTAQPTVRVPAIQKPLQNPCTPSKSAKPAKNSKAVNNQERNSKSYCNDKDKATPIKGTSDNRIDSGESEIIHIIKAEDGDDDSGSDLEVDIEMDDAGLANDHDYGEDVVYRKLVESAGIRTPKYTQDVDSDSAEEDPQQTGEKDIKSPLSRGFSNFSSEGQPETKLVDAKMFGNVEDCANGVLHCEGAIVFDTNSQLHSEKSINAVQEHTEQQYPRTSEHKFTMKCGTNEAACPLDTDATRYVGCGVFDPSNTEQTEEVRRQRNSNQGGDEEVEEPNSAHCSLSEESVESDSQDEHMNEGAVYTSTGEQVYLPNPTQELILGRDEISNEEQYIHSEFFDDRPGMKTRERYLKIRNFILDAWLECKPNYLNKTCVRPGLKNCGDVNCIGRIHAYLEQVGAINFGCAQAQYNKPLKCVGTKTKMKREDVQAIQAVRTENSRPRKRRVRDMFGQWVNEKDLEGRTIEHTVGTEKRYSKILRARPTQYDPFKLVPCNNFSFSIPAPFTVEIESSALVVMDTHAHLSKTEVIGLLGGRYHREQGKLHIILSEPCDSLSTGMQCEMDPVSQTQASEEISSQGCHVIGWYHSHPTFEPNPSVRDIETQEKFQDWFAQGGSPFIGIIVSPYSQQNTYQSQVRCLVVSKQHALPTTLGLPYQFSFDTVHGEWNTSTLLSRLRALITKYAKYPNRVEMLHYFRSIQNITCLEKLLHSVGQYLPVTVEGNTISEFKDRVREIFSSAFTAVDQSQVNDD